MLFDSEPAYRDRSHVVSSLFLLGVSVSNRISSYSPRISLLFKLDQGIIVQLMSTRKYKGYIIGCDLIFFSDLGFDVSS